MQGRNADDDEAGRRTTMKQAAHNH